MKDSERTAQGKEKKKKKRTNESRRLKSVPSPHQGEEETDGRCKQANIHPPAFRRAARESQRNFPNTFFKPVVSTFSFLSETCGVNLGHVSADSSPSTTAATAGLAGASLVIHIISSVGLHAQRPSTSTGH